MLPTWQTNDGSVRLFLGDCRDVVPHLELIDCTMTSPPYNQLDGLPETGTGLWGRSAGGAGFLRAWGENGYADKMTEAEYVAWQNDLFATVHRVSRPTGSLFYNHQLRWRDGTCLHPVRWFEPDGWKMRAEIIWDRAGGMMFNARMFCRFDERILWYIAGESWKWNQASVGHGTIWRIAREQQQQGKQHPVAFPLEVPERCIAAATDEGDVVLDPFMGSGTTGVAAVKLGRKFVGIEREQRYFDIACRRLEAELNRNPLFELPTPLMTQQQLTLE